MAFLLASLLASLLGPLVASVFGFSVCFSFAISAERMVLEGFEAVAVGSSWILASLLSLLAHGQLGFIGVVEQLALEVLLSFR